MKLDFLQVALIAFAVWILVRKSNGEGNPIDWPELLAIAILTQVASMLWQEA